MFEVEPVIWVGGVVIIQTTLLLLALLNINSILSKILEKLEAKV